MLTRAILQFIPVTGVYYQLVFDDDVLAAISQESDEDAGGVWQLQINDTLYDEEMSGAGVGGFLSNLQSTTYFLYCEKESGYLKIAFAQTVFKNNAFQYANFLKTTLESEFDAQIKKLETRVSTLEAQVETLKTN